MPLQIYAQLATNQKKHSPDLPQKNKLSSIAIPRAIRLNSTFSNSHKSARPPAPLHNSKPTTNESNTLLQGVAYLKIVLLVDRGAAATKTKPSTLDKYHCLKAMTWAFPKALAKGYCDVVALRNNPVFTYLKELFKSIPVLKVAFTSSRSK